MSLIVEDGTGLSNANSYAARADADAYFALRNDTTWSAASTTARDAALVEATSYLDLVYPWSGTILTHAQALGWPRLWVTDDEGRAITGVPAGVVEATYVLARVALDQDLLPALPRGGMITEERLDSLEVSYAAGAPLGVVHPRVDALLRGLVRGSRSTYNVPLRRV